MSTITETQYDTLVREGRDAREQADNVQWTEGDLALQIDALPSHERPRDPETGAFLADPDKALKRYAQDIDINYSSLQEYRTTSRSWPPSRRLDRVAWGAHQALNAQDDRFDLLGSGMTIREARDIVRKRAGRANTGGKPGWHELLGRVGDSLTEGLKHLEKIEAELDREPSDVFIAKAQGFAARADDIAARLRRIHEPPEQAA